MSLPPHPRQGACGENSLLEGRYCLCYSWYEKEQSYLVISDLKTVNWWPQYIFATGNTSNSGKCTYILKNTKL